MEGFLGTLIAGGAVIWAAWISTEQGLNPVALVTDPRPVELLGFGALVWLHARWRRWAVNR